MVLKPFIEDNIEKVDETLAKTSSYDKNRHNCALGFSHSIIWNLLIFTRELLYVHIINTIMTTIWLPTLLEETIREQISYTLIFREFWLQWKEEVDFDFSFTNSDKWAGWWKTAFDNLKDKWIIVETDTNSDSHYIHRGKLMIFGESHWDDYYNSLSGRWENPSEVITKFYSDYIYQKTNGEYDIEYQDSILSEWIKKLQKRYSGNFTTDLNDCIQYLSEEDKNEYLSHSNPLFSILRLEFTSNINLYELWIKYIKIEKERIPVFQFTLSYLEKEENRRVAPEEFLPKSIQTEFTLKIQWDILKLNNIPVPLSRIQQSVFAQLSVSAINGKFVSYEDIARKIETNFDGFSDEAKEKKLNSIKQAFVTLNKKIILEIGLPISNIFLLENRKVTLNSLYIFL